MNRSSGFLSRWALLGAVAGSFLLPSTAVAQPTPISPPVVQKFEPRQVHSLVEFWLSVPDVSQVNWSYAFISTDKSSTLRLHQRAALISELEIAKTNLAAPSADAAQLQHWITALGTIQEFRVPGRYDPAHLIAHPGRIPPVGAVSSAGYCNSVPWIEIWDTRGVRRMPWYPSMNISKLVSRGDIGVLPRTSWIELVLPWGAREQVGIAPWNIEDQPVIAGTRVVAPFESANNSTDWLNRSLPDFLAHAIPGDACWRSEIVSKPVPDQ